MKQDHPIAEIFPLISDAELQSLASDIQEHGLLEPITLYEGKILDGRNRERACQLVKVDPRYRDFEGKSPTAFVVSENLERRHLTASQRACCAVEALPFFEDEAEERRRQHAGTEPGKPKNTCGINVTSDPGKARDKAAEQYKTSGTYVSDAKAIKEESPEDFEDIKKGKKTVTQVKRERRKKNIVKRIATLPTDRFRVLYADPPWEYGDTLGTHLREPLGPKVITQQ